MPLRDIERRIIVGSRFFTVMAVVGALAASVLMFFLGLYNIYAAFRFGLITPSGSDDVQFGTAAVISVIEGLDRFLIGIVLLYFAYGVYSLFLHPEEALMAPEEAEAKLALPAWLRVRQIGQLKQVVAEVIVVILFVLFLRIALESFREPRIAMSWNQIATIILLPVSTALLALSLRLVELHPKPSTAEARSSAADAERVNDAQETSRKSP